MKRKFIALLLFSIFAFLAGCAEENTPASPASPQGSGFDFYVLALSWSPGYCASEGARADKRQCGNQRRYEFVVHGLWPQFEKGYPANCDSKFGERVDNKLAGAMTDIMPSFDLIRHEWKKHGRCSGLSQSDYFDVTRDAYERIALPPSFKGLTETKTISPHAVEKLFQAANPTIPSNGIAVTCKGNYLRDVRICMTADLASFRPCPEIDRNACRKRTIAVAPVR